jgi:hypothetical protein
MERGEIAVAATYMHMAPSIDALDLPIQLFAIGTAMGMLAALLRHYRTGELDHWPVYVAIYALAWFGAGLLISVGLALR